MAFSGSLLRRDHLGQRPRRRSSTATLRGRRQHSRATGPVAHRRPRLHRGPHRRRRDPAAVPDRGDHPQGLRADDPVQASAPASTSTSPRKTPSTSSVKSTALESRHRPGVHDAGHRGVGNARDRCAPHRLRQGSAPAGVRRHQERGVQLPTGGVSYSGLNTRIDSSPTRCDCRSSRFSTSTASR